jgi:SPP1 family predicted phage head-tail adaptor
MRAGPLRHRVVIQRPLATRTSYGEEQIAWITAAEMWAQIEPITGREFLQANIANPEQILRVTLRYSPALVDWTPKWRILFRDLIFDIQSVRDVGLMKRMMEVMVRNGRTAG